jgi:hypothetical protein
VSSSVVIIAGLFAGWALLVSLVMVGFESPPQPAKRISRKSHRNAELRGLRMFHLAFRAFWMAGAFRREIRGETSATT